MSVSQNVDEPSSERRVRYALFGVMFCALAYALAALLSFSTLSASANFAGQLRYRSLLVHEEAVEGNWVEVRSQLAIMRDLRGKLARDYAPQLHRTDSAFEALVTEAQVQQVPRLAVVFDHVRAADELTRGVVARGETALLRAAASAGAALLVMLFALILQQRMVLRLRNAQAILANLAAHDALTGLANRRTLFDELQCSVALAERHGHPLSVALIDLDFFKRVNDTHGHQMGDSVLVHFAQIARERLRQGDLVARYGGEEFALLLGHCDLAGAAQLADALRVELADSPLGDIVTTCSIGVAQLRAGENPQALIGRADSALLRAKREGRNRVCTAAGESGRKASDSHLEVPSSKRLAARR